MGLAKLRYHCYALHLVCTQCAVSSLKKGDIFWESGNLSLFSVEDNNVVVLTTSFWQEWVSVDNLTTLGMGYWGMVYYSVEWCWAIAWNIYKTVFDDVVIIKNVWLSEIEFLMAGSSEWLVSDGERRDEVVLALQLCDHFLLMPVWRLSRIVISLEWGF